MVSQTLSHTPILRAWSLLIITTMLVGELLMAFGGPGQTSGSALIMLAVLGIPLGLLLKALSTTIPARSRGRLGAGLAVLALLGLGVALRVTASTAAVLPQLNGCSACSVFCAAA